MFVSICLEFSNLGAYSNIFVDREGKDSIRLGFDLGKKKFVCQEKREIMYRKRNYVKREKFYFYDILYMRVV
jgi:hypothetical protein